jgi:hypothetical protein
MCEPMIHDGCGFVRDADARELRGYATPDACWPIIQVSPPPEREREWAPLYLIDSAPYPYDPNPLPKHQGR